jgi:O-methyltransferase involved in polyketide biosynthesis
MSKRFYLIPPWFMSKIRQVRSRENPSILNDTKATELVEGLDYDFARLDKSLGVLGNLMHAARAKHLDDKIRAYIAKHPEASVIDLGRSRHSTLKRTKLKLRTIDYL